MSDLGNIGNVTAFGCRRRHPDRDGVICYRARYHAGDHRGPDPADPGRTHEWPDPARLETEKRLDDLWDEAHDLEDVGLPALASLQSTRWPVALIVGVSVTATLQLVIVALLVVVLAS